jgi:SAM-dependent methyltransferase
MTGWTNDAAIQRWGTMPRAALEEMAYDGDFAKRHLVNPALLRMLGDVRGRRVLDAGCGNGYLSRMLAGRGAQVVGVEPGQALFDFAVEKESQRPLGIRYVRADLCDLPGLGGPFDAVVASMVLPAIPDWAGAMRACVQALSPGGIFVFTVNHPCFEQLWRSWREHGEYRSREYLAEYEIDGLHGVDFHRPLSTYLNELISLGCRLREVAEPALDPAVAARGPDGIVAYVHLPNFLLVAADRERQSTRAAAVFD